MPKRKYRGDRPFHLREYIYTTREAIATLKCSTRTLFTYMKQEPLTFPTSKAFVTNWAKRQGYPYSKRKMSIVTEDRIRLVRKSTQSTRKLAKLLNVSQTYIMKLKHMNLPKEDS